MRFTCIPSAPLDELSTPPVTRVPLFPCLAFPVPRACAYAPVLGVFSIGVLLLSLSLRGVVFFSFPRREDLSSFSLLYISSLFFFFLRETIFPFLVF